MRKIGQGKAQVESAPLSADTSRSISSSFGPKTLIADDPIYNIKPPYQTPVTHLILNLKSVFSLALTKIISTALLSWW